MLIDELKDRLQAAADEQPFLPDVAPVLQRARRLQRHRRVGLAGGLAALCAVAAIGAVAVVDSTRSTGRTVAGAVVQPQAAPAVTFTTKSDAINDTCAVLTFTETGDNIDADCSHLTSDIQATGLVTMGGFGQARVNAGAPPTTIALGALAGGGTVLISDETGRQIRAVIVPPPSGYPYSVYYANLGAGTHWPAHITYIAPNGTQHIYNMPSPPPTSP